MPISEGLPASESCIDVDDCPGHQAGGARCEEEDRACNLLRRSHPSHGRVSERSASTGTTIGVIGGRVGVYPDAAKRPLGGLRAREMIDRRLGDIIGRLGLRPVADMSRHRAEVHDGAAFQRNHETTEGARAPEDAVEIDVHHARPVRLGELLRRDATLANSSIFHEDRRRPPASASSVAIASMRAASVTSPTRASTSQSLSRSARACQASVSLRSMTTTAAPASASATGRHRIASACYACWRTWFSLRSARLITSGQSWQATARGGTRP